MHQKKHGFVQWCYQLGALVIACHYFFSINETMLFVGYDGSYMRELLSYQHMWLGPWLSYTNTPLQGLGNIAFPVNFWWSPASVLGYILGGPTPDPVVVYSVTTIELFLSTAALGRAMRLSRAVILVSAWLAAAMVMPFLHPAPFYPISGLIPWVIEHISLCNLVGASLIWVGRGTRGENILCGVLSVLLLLHMLLFVAHSFVLCAPVLLALVVTLLVTCCDQRERHTKLKICAALLA